MLLDKGKALNLFCFGSMIMNGGDHESLHVGQKIKLVILVVLQEERVVWWHLW